MQSANGTNEVFERYEINFAKKYGEGGYGVTFGARDKQTNEELAVKMVDTKRMCERAILKECEILEKLKHESIIDIKAYCRGMGHYAHYYFIFMELASGGELFDQVIDRGAAAMPEDMARGYLIQILNALRMCHFWGIAHRDLKLENVLLNGEGKVKLIDFGLSHIYVRAADKSVDRSKQLFDVCGSPSYAAPEILASSKQRGVGYDGFMADTWSFGVCLFAMVSGFFPLDQATSTDWRFNKLKDEQLRNPRASTTAAIYQWYGRNTAHLTRELVDLLDKLMVINPNARITLDEVTQHPWILGQKLAVPTNADYSADDYPVYRGALNMGFDSESSEVLMDEDEMPVYRSLGPGMFDDGPGGDRTPPPLMRKMGNFNLNLGETGIIGDEEVA